MNPKDYISPPIGTLAIRSCGSIHWEYCNGCCNSCYKVTNPCTTTDHTIPTNTSISNSATMYQDLCLRGVKLNDS